MKDTAFHLIAQARSSAEWGWPVDLCRKQTLSQQVLLGEQPSVASHSDLLAYLPSIFMLQLGHITRVT